MPQPKRKPTAEKPAAKVEDVKEPEAPEAPALDDAATPDPALDAETSGDPGNDEGDAPDDTSEADEGEGDEPEVEAETGMVDEPCRKCFPDGWPVAEVDAFASCAHGFGIRYGDQVEITRERAVELGFLDEE